MDRINAIEFLEELTVLTRKYGVIISGCGDCESPWLEYRSSDYKAALQSQVKWIEAEQRYSYESYGEVR